MNKCGRCIHATNSDKCPWATRFEPVPGWVAEKTVISPNQDYRVESYYIKACPLYERGHSSPEYDLDDIRTLIAETLRQAADDWKMLEYGRIAEKRVAAQVIKASDLLEFFQSKDFAAMYRFVTRRDPVFALEALKIKEVVG